MDSKNRREIDTELLDSINGGTLYFNPEASGTYSMTCEFCGDVYSGISLTDVIRLGQFMATIPNTAEGEQEILAWARDAGII